MAKGWTCAMHRRGLLTGVLGVGAGAAAAQAAIVCLPRDAQGVRRCDAGVQVPLRAARQRCPNWCWAACLEAVFAMNGLDVAQDAITQKLFGGLICMPSAGVAVASGVGGRWNLPGGRQFDVVAEVLWNEPGFFARPEALARAAEELSQGVPLIADPLGHASVIASVGYRQEAAGAQRLDRLIVRDPWPGNPTRRTLTPREAAAATFLAKITVI